MSLINDNYAVLEIDVKKLFNEEVQDIVVGDEDQLGILVPILLMIVWTKFILLSKNF